MTTSDHLNSEKKVLSGAMVLLLAAANGLVVANLYYSQPLLTEIAKTFGFNGVQAGLIVSLTQVGYGLGLLFLIPLGDQMERRRLIVILLVFASLSLAVLPLVRSGALFLSGCLVVGLVSVVPQIIIPLVASLSSAEQRNRNLGTAMSGLLLGILLARVVSGFVGGHFGWPVIFWCGAAAMLGLAMALGWKLPAGRPAGVLGYGRLLGSLPGLLRHYGPLQEAAVNGGLLFAGFSVFWTTLIFRLEATPLGLGARTAGLFGLIGVFGALAASLSGRLADRVGPSRLVMAGTGLVLLSWVIMWIGGEVVWGLAAGALVLDFGIQIAHVANQSRIFAHLPGARSRVNTIYMVAFFIGGASGSLAGAQAWKEAGWSGVCLLGLGLMTLALLAGFMFSRRRTQGVRAWNSGADGTVREP